MSIKIVNAAYHANIGDCLSSRYLRGIVETLSGQDTELIGYDIDYSDFSGVSAIILGTGGTLGQFNKTPILDLDKIPDIPIIIFGAGFNREYNQPYDYEWEEYTKKLMPRVMLGGLRNNADAELAKKFGLKQSYWCPDPLLFLNNPTPKLSQFTVGLSLGEYTQYLEYDIVGAINKVFPEFGIFQILHEGYTNHFQFGIYNECDYVITSRYHCALLSASFNVPVFFIKHNIKHDNLYTDMYPDLELDNYCSVDNMEMLEIRLSCFRNHYLQSVDSIIEYKGKAITAYNKFCRMFEELI